MKRFGIPVLLSAVYVFLMVLVFSSEFGQNNSFFLPDQKTDQAEVIPENTDTSKTATTPIPPFRGFTKLVSQGREAAAAHRSH